MTTFRTRLRGLKASVSLSSLCDQESVWPALAVVARVRRQEHNLPCGRMRGGIASDHQSLWGPPSCWEKRPQIPTPVWQEWEREGGP